MHRFAFTLIELIFVIVVMGILAKFGVEFLAQAYNSFIFSSVNNALQSKSEMAVEAIASRLQYRIKDSIIARQPGVTFQALASSTLAENATVLEWVGEDIDGLRGDSSALPLWSGVIDLDLSSAGTLVSPQTNTAALNTLIGRLSYGGSGIDNAALYFRGSDTSIDRYGWNGIALTDHNTSVMHPIRSNGVANQFVPINGASGADNSFTGADVYEYYQLAWSAYAVVHNPNNGELRLYYDYQPWLGESYSDNGVKNQLIMQDVDTFRFRAVGSIVKIQVCTKTNLMEDYSLCKEKTVF